MARAEEARRNGLHGATEDRGRVLVAEAFDFAEQEGLAELGRQLLDRAFDRLVGFARLGELVGPLVVGVARHERLVVVARKVAEQAQLELAPTQLVEGKTPGGRSYRLGGMVQPGSLQRESGTLKIAFTVSDKLNEVPVTYTGIVPDLFKEGTGVVAEGQMREGVFVAHTILAKHDENYMPPGVKAK